MSFENLDELITDLEFIRDNENGPLSFAKAIYVLACEIRDLKKRIKMKVTFETDDYYEINCFVNAQKMRICIHELNRLIRNKLKHESPSEETVKVLEEIREMLRIEAFDD